ncbi:MAG: response regulator [Gammaproteobacteria bacterium]|nr:response regulator [Gammaproteobacteria bacterium]
MDKNPVSQTILVVDDNDLNRRLVTLTLGKLGYAIVNAVNGVDALQRVARGGIDLVLLDIAMPEMDGIEVLTRLRTQYSMLELPVIMFTADDDEAHIVEALSLGANDYLLKPLNQAIAAARIKTQLSIACLSKLKDKFLHFASHDLKKPMLVIADIIETVRGMQTQQEARLAELFGHLDLIEQTNQRMQDVVHGFLDQNLVQQRDTPVSGHINLNEVIQEMQTLNVVYANKKRTVLDTDLAADLPLLKADAFRVRQVLDNMIGNAIKFSPCGTQVLIRSQALGDSVLIEVIDEGPGLTQSDQRNLFKRGVALSNRPTGGENSTGIGLSMCKELIEAEGGKIGARVNQDRGTTFWFSLPY